MRNTPPPCAGRALWWLSFTLFVLCVSETMAAVPALELSKTSPVVVVGDFAGLSYFESKDQVESVDPETNSVFLERNGVYERVASVDGKILTTCVLNDTVYIGGNFSHINNTAVNNIAQYNMQSHTLASLADGLNGSVHALYCGQGGVYVGGSFQLASGTNQGGATLWSTSSQSWAGLPWKGFNGPVYTIAVNPTTKTLFFGGRFDATGDGRYTSTNFGEPIDTSLLTSVSSQGKDEGDLINVVCQNAPQSSWLLEKGVPGHLDVQFGYSIRLSMLRLTNVRQLGRGTRSFSVTTRGSKKYLHLSFVDPITGRKKRCSHSCTLSNDSTVYFQDFAVDNNVTTDGIRIHIKTWYGAGGGLSQLQVFQKDTIIHPLKNKACVSTVSSTTLTVGKWKEERHQDQKYPVLSTSIPMKALETSNASITYQPYIPTAAYYDVYAITPACTESDDCQCRISVDLEIKLSQGNTTLITIDQASHSNTTILIYSGLILPGTGATQPTIQLRPHISGPQTKNELEKRNRKHSASVVAETIQLVRRNTTSPQTLASILEYSPQNYTTNPAAISWNPLREQMAVGSIVRSIDASALDALYIGGEFTSSQYQYLVSYKNEKLTPVNNEQLNGAISVVQLVGTTLFVGGDFNGTNNTAIPNLNHVARIDVSRNSASWAGLGMGIDGPVEYIVQSEDRTSITLSGLFSTNNTSNSNSKQKTYNNVLWNVTTEEWADSMSLVVGSITTMTLLNTPNTRLWAGEILGAQTYRANALVFGQNETVQRLSATDENTSIDAGSFWNDSRSDESVVILARQSGVDDMTRIIMNYPNGTQYTFGNLNGTVHALTVLQDNLYVAGKFEGSADDLSAKSLVVYNLSNRSVVLASQIYDQNASLGLVRVMRVQPDGGAIYIGGSFTLVGTVGCNGICVLNTETMQWNLASQSEPVSGQVHDLSVTKDQVIALGLLSENSQTGQIAVLQNNMWTMSSFPNIDSASSGSDTPNTMVQQGSQWFIAGKSSKTGVFLGSWNGINYTDLLQAETAQLGPSSDIQQLMIAPLPSSSIQSFPPGSNSTLLAIGHLQINTFGNASAAFFDGSTWHPYLLTTTLDGQPGRIRQMMYASQCCTAADSSNHLPAAAVVLISIAISTGILFALTGLAFFSAVIRRPKGGDVMESMPVWLPGQGFTDNALAAVSASAAAVGVAGAAGAFATRSSIENSRRRRTWSPPVPPLPPMLTPSNVSPAAETTALPFDALLAAAKNYTGGPVSESNPRLCYAAHPFNADESHELELQRGETFVVTDTSTDPEWWYGSKADGSGNTLSGVFPSNRVEFTHPTAG